MLGCLCLIVNDFHHFYVEQLLHSLFKLLLRNIGADLAMQDEVEFVAGASYKVKLRYSPTPIEDVGALSETFEGKTFGNLQKIGFLVDLPLFEEVQVLKQGHKDVEKLLLRPVNRRFHQYTFDKLAM